MKRLTMLFLLAALLLTACSPAFLQEYMTAPGGILLQDDFSQPSGMWPVGSADLGATSYYQGAYRVQVNAPNADFRAVAGKKYYNVRLDVLAGKFGGPDANRIGLICRYLDAGNFYFFVMTSDGFFAVGKMLNGESMLLGSDAFEPTLAIHTGMNINNLRAECVGSTLRFYINDTLVSEVQDTAFTAGDVGFLAGTFDMPGADIVFDDFLVVKAAP